MRIFLHILEFAFVITCTNILLYIVSCVNIEYYI